MVAITSQSVRYHILANGCYQRTVICSNVLTNGCHKALQCISYSILANGWYQFAVIRSNAFKPCAVNWQFIRYPVLANGCYQFAGTCNNVLVNGCYQLADVRSKTLANSCFQFNFIRFLSWERALKWPVNLGTNWYGVKDLVGERALKDRSSLAPVDERSWIVQRNATRPSWEGELMGTINWQYLRCFTLSTGYINLYFPCCLVPRYRCLPPASTIC